jgi:hypothetical protein
MTKSYITSSKNKSKLSFNRTAKVYVPFKLLELLNYVHTVLQKNGKGNNEFGFYLNSDIDLQTLTATVNLSKPIFYPNQTVSPAHISFDECPGVELFNTAIHRHPAGVTGFSGTDVEFINQFADVSLIFIPPNLIPAAEINFKLTNTSFITMPAQVIITYELDIPGLFDINPNATSTQDQFIKMNPADFAGKVNERTKVAGNPLAGKFNMGAFEQNIANKFPLMPERSAKFAVSKSRLLAATKNSAINIKYVPVPAGKTIGDVLLDRAVHMLSNLGVIIVQEDPLVYIEGVVSWAEILTVIAEQISIYRQTPIVNLNEVKYIKLPEADAENIMELAVEILCEEAFHDHDELNISDNLKELRDLTFSNDQDDLNDILDRTLSDE